MLLACNQYFRELFYILPSPSLKRKSWHWTQIFDENVDCISTRASRTVSLFTKSILEKSINKLKMLIDKVTYDDYGRIYITFRSPNAVPMLNHNILEATLEVSVQRNHENNCKEIFWTITNVQPSSATLSATITPSVLESCHEKPIGSDVCRDTMRRPCNKQQKRE